MGWWVVWQLSEPYFRINAWHMSHHQETFGPNLLPVNSFGDMLSLGKGNKNLICLPRFTEKSKFSHCFWLTETYPNDTVKLLFSTSQPSPNHGTNCKWDANIPSWKVCEKRCCVKNKLSAIDAIALDLLALHPYQSPSLDSVGSRINILWFSTPTMAVQFHSFNITRKNAINFWFDISCI